MKLYRVEVTKVVYVVGFDEEEVVLEAIHYAEEDDGEPRVHVSLANANGIKADNAQGSLVYGRHEGDWQIEDALRLNGPEKQTKAKE